MNNYEDWAQLVAKRLKGEADIIAAIEKDELEDTAANDAFVRAVLEPFLPENFGVGSGRIVDAFGNQSEHIDIVVYNRDFPRIGMVGANSAFLYESVLAVFSVRAKFIRKTFFDALNACASLAQLETNIDKAVLIKLAKKNGLKPAPNKKFVHDDPLRTARFELIGRPPAFVYGFNGIKHSYRQLQENIELWMDNRRQNEIETPMKALPAVIATQGCFSWRNAAPLALSNRELLGIGNDDAPIRLIVLQLLYLLNRRLNVTADGYGLKPSLNAYLSQFSAPKFEIGVGNVDLAKPGESGEAGTASATMSARYEPAKDHSPVKTAAVDIAATKPPAETVEPTPVPLPETIGPAADAEPAAEAVVLDKSSPFASAPILPVATPAPVTTDTDAQAAAPAPVATDTDAQAADQAAVFDKASPFASAPVPPIEDPAPAPAAKAAPKRSPAPAAALGSAPIPSMKPAGNAAKSPPVDSPIPPKPPVDFDLAKETNGANQETAEVKDETYTNTVIIPQITVPPSTAASSKDGANQETAEVEDETYTNTVVIPQITVPPSTAASSKDGANQETAEVEDETYTNTVVIPQITVPPSKDAAQKNSTDAFIAKVKKQLTTSEPAAEKGTDSFSSTIPQ